MIQSKKFSYVKKLTSKKAIKGCEQQKHSSTFYRLNKSFIINYLMLILGLLI